MRSTRDPIRIQEFAVHVITAADQRAIHRGYVASMAKRGIDVRTERFGAFMTAEQRRQRRKVMAALADDVKQEGGDL